MRAVYSSPVLYRVNATLVSPLRTGGTDGDAETVLRDACGCPYVQGTSIAGAMREWLNLYAPEYTARLMGEPKDGQKNRYRDDHRGSGRLVVSDGIFGSNAEQYIRPRLKINEKTGTAKDGAKFDMAHIGAGSDFEFTITWLGNPQQKAELAVVEQILAAMNAGEIRLGGQKTNGFGCIKVDVWKCAFDLTKAEDRQAWLKAWQDESKTVGEKLSLPKLQHTSLVRFTLTGMADSLLVRAAAVEQTEDEISFTPNIIEGGCPILPGSSVKGAVKSRAKSIAALVGISKEKFDEIFGRGAEAENDDCGVAGRVCFTDLRLRPLHEAPLINRIRINKFTGGVIQQGLFREQPVYAPISLELTVPDDPIACALLLYALRDLGYGLYNLGGNGSIGRGFIRTETICMEAPDGRRACIKMEDGNAVLEDPSGLVAEWLKAWGGIHHEA